MNTEALFIFLILLLGLVLFSFLSNKCSREGFDASSTENTTGENTTSNMLNTGVIPVNNMSNTLYNNYDNYDHYNRTGSSSQLQSGLTFTDISGNTMTVISNSDGTKSIQLLQLGQNTPVTFSSMPPSNLNSSYNALPNTFYFGNVNANVITDNNGQLAIQFNLPNGQNVIFTQSGTNMDNINSTQYYGSTGNPIQKSNSTLAYSGYNDDTFKPNTESLSKYNNGLTTDYGNKYSTSLPAGIPTSQIPQGKEHLYILKSEIVPPVCPACPTSAACPRQEKCPPCPACARCPEPSFECKKVPNYNAINNDSLPIPVLNDFSQFGM